MNINSINAMNFGLAKNFRMRMSKKKIEKTEKAIDETLPGVLPKELPLEKKIYYVTHEEAFNRIKDSIQLSIEKMRNQ